MRFDKPKKILILLSATLLGVLTGACWLLNAFGSSLHLASAGTLAATTLLGLFVLCKTSTADCLPALRIREERWLEKIYNHTIDAIVCIDRDMKVLTFNKAAERILGYRSQEIVGHRVNDHWPDQTQLAMLSTALNGVPSEAQRRAEERVRRAIGYRKDGTSFPMEIAVTRMPRDTEDVFLVIIRDKSQADAMAREAESNAAFREAILASSLSGRITIDEAGCILEYSQVAGSIFGFAKDEVIGQPMAELIIPAELRDRHLEGMRRYLENRVGTVINQRIEIVALHKRGHVFPIELTISPVEVGDQVFFTAEVRDITERKQFEEDLKAAKLAAEASNEAKGRFLATMSHEIRTPLNAVLGILGLLRRAETDSHRLHLLHTAEQSGRNLLSVISDVLDYSKIEAGKMTVEPEAMCVADVIREVAGLFATKAQAKDLNLCLFIDPTLPRTVVADKSKISQVLMNLVSNAMKFTSTGSIEISVTRCSSPDRHRFVVEDTGIGVSPESRPLLFQEFSQVDTSDSRRFGGTGLGLTICKNLVELMGGKIGVESQLGEGSVFFFELPLEVANPAPLMHPAPAGTHVTLLAADAGVSRTISRQLDSFQVDIASFNNADAALRHLNQHAYGRYTRSVVCVVQPVEGMTLAEFAGELAQRQYPVGELLLCSRQTRNLQDIAVPVRQLRQPLDPFELQRAIAGARSTERPSNAAGNPGAEPEPELQAEGSVRVLLAEDSQANQLVAGTILMDAGYEVDVVSNGLEAYSALMSLPYDVVLMDVQMPEMNGIDATRQIRKLEGSAAATPIVALTAKAFKHDLEACLEAGMNDYISKPVERTSLLRTVKRWSSAKTESPLIDPTVIEELQSIGGEGAFGNMMNTFLEETRDRVARIHTLVEDWKPDALAAEFHTLKSTAATFGAVALANSARGLEASILDGELNGSSNRLEELFTLADASSIAIARDYLANPVEAAEK